MQLLHLTLHSSLPFFCELFVNVSSFEGVLTLPPLKR